MAANSSVVKLACILVAICMTLGRLCQRGAVAEPEDVISCSGVEDTLRPCIPHLKSTAAAATPPGNCCVGVQSVHARAKTTAEHRATCQCMKQTAANIQGLNYELAAKLPGQCGVSMSYTFSPNTDCTKVV